jgi:RNA polymerase sigma factor (sigma-70 family)
MVSDSPATCAATIDSTRSPTDAQAFTEEMYTLLVSVLRRQRRKRNHTLTLDTHDLAQESYLRLREQRSLRNATTAEFQAAAWVTGQRVLLDYLRARARKKHAPEGGHIPLQDMQDVQEPAANAPEQALTDGSLVACLEELQRVDPEAMQIIKLRFYDGHSVDAAAAQLGLSAATLARRWRTIRAWLMTKLG